MMSKMFELYKRESHTLLEGLKAGTLPDSNGWGHKTPGGFGLAQIAARNDLLPDDFSQWYLIDDYGIPVSHIALERGTLPPDFNDWEIRDAMGRTVAHVFVQTKPLPPDFDLWTMRDRCGFNVAETACIHNNLPPGVTDWRELIKISGTPKNIVPPILPWPISALSLAKPPDVSKLPTMHKISVATANGDDFIFLMGNFLDAFYLHDTAIRNMMLKDAPIDLVESWQVPFLGGTAAVLARRFDLETPAWAAEQRCFLPDYAPYWPYHDSDNEILIAPASTPPEFQDRNLFLSGYVLYRV